jgi:hypothetical protein
MTTSVNPPGHSDEFTRPPLTYPGNKSELAEENRREDADKRVGMGGERAPESDPTPSTRAYLVVKAWRRSGNSTVALAPWLRASDEKMETVVEPPEECGLPVALKLAREYVAEHTDHTRDTPAAGQSGISQWATQ